MSYQVIARKYRPQRFADVVGQEHVTQTLSNAINGQRIAHAYLFVGPRGTGKTTIARIFAKCLNCTGGPKVEFPDDDPQVQQITEGRSLDVLEIDGASNRGIEEIRELRETVKYLPASSKFKIYIIDEVHMLTKEAFNALLKTLEEPPPHVKFMFATTEAEKVLPTILSRCQRFDLRRIPTALIVQHLDYIAKKENVSAEQQALYAIARSADGGMRDAESILDQLISFCGENIVEADVLSMFGLAAQGQIVDLAESVLGGDANRALQVLTDLARGGKDLGRLVGDLLSYFRNLLVFQVSNGDTRLLEVSESELASLKKNSAEITAEALTRIMEVLSTCESRLRDAGSKKIMIEIFLLKAIQARSAVSIDEVLKQLNEMRSPSGGASAPTILRETPAPARATAAPRSLPETPATKPISQTQSAQVATAPAMTPPPVARPATSAEPTKPAAVGLNELWVQLLDGVGRASAFAKSYLVQGFPVSLVGSTLTIGFDPSNEDQLSLVDNPKNRSLIQARLTEMGYANPTVKFSKTAAPAGSAPVSATVVESAPLAAASSPFVPLATSKSAPSAAVSPAPAADAPPIPAPRKTESIAFNKDDFKNDPLIQKALEMFKGTIVEVRA